MSPKTPHECILLLLDGYILKQVIGRVNQRLSYHLIRLTQELDYNNTKNLAFECQFLLSEDQIGMDIFFQDPSVIPLPPEEVRILRFKATPWPDGRRVHIDLEITPFQKRPSGELVIHNAAGEEVASMTIVEAITPRMEFTMHLKGKETSGVYTASATIYYLVFAQSTQLDQTISIQESREAGVPSEHLIVDCQEIKFEVPELAD